MPFDSWKRAELLKKTAATLREHASHIAGIMMDEVAKPYAAALSEVLRTADLFEFTAEEGVRMAGELLLSDAFPGEKRNKLALVQRVPLGVVVAIPPYNYPLNLAGSKVGPALMAGNAIVMKPPSAGAVTGLVGIAAVMDLAGAPAGLVNVVTGKGSEIGDYLTQHHDAHAVSFTGGGTGLRVAKGAGMIPLQMELGGKDPALVLPDCNIKKTAAAIVKGAFSYSGQRCTAVKVVYIVEKDGEVSSQLLPLILEGVKKLKVGMPWDDKVDITSVIDAKSAAFIKGLVDDAVQNGAKMELPEEGWKQTGNLIEPVVLTGVNKDMRLLYEEQFGPVLPILSVTSAEEALDMANQSPLGLQASVFTQDIDAAMRISDALQAGTVQINGAPARGPDHFPFQGFKDSGLSSQGVRYSIEAMTKIKSTVINLADESYTQG
jgi:glyceraldehyde-3-phosphate dehydrogenase (NADP+)